MGGIGEVWGRCGATAEASWVAWRPESRLEFGLGLAWG